MGVDPGSLAVKAALYAVQMGLAMMNKTEGPRLDSLDVTTADYGTPIVRFWGKRRLEGCPIIHAEKLREKKVTSKTKGGKYSEYKYYGTFAVLIADHVIDGVSRIWMDKHLVYDATKARPISGFTGVVSGLSNSPVKLTRSKNMRIYDGTQTEPDPRYESWCEDRYGPDSAPAYKGLSYVFFEELPLEKFGNRIPQITIEAVSSSNEPYLSLTKSESYDSDILVSPDFSRLVVGSAAYDVPTHEKIVDYPAAPDALGSGASFYTLTDWLGTGGGPYVTYYTGDGYFSSVLPAAPSPSSTLLVRRDPYGDDQVILGSYFGANTGYQIITPADATPIDANITVVEYAISGDGAGYVFGQGSGGFYICPVPSAAATFVATGSSDSPVARFNENGEVVVFQGTRVSRVATDGTILQTTNALGIGGNISWSGDGRTAWAIGSGTASEIDITDLTLIRSLDMTDWVNEGVDYGYYDPINHAIASINTLGHLTFRFLDRVSSNGTPLATVFNDVSEWVGVAPDVTSIDQTIDGYSVTQGTAKDMLQPLLDIHDIDPRPHNFDVQFIKRSQSSSGSIVTSQFVREEDEPRYRVTIKQDTDLPRRITLNFADKEKDQQTNTVISQRPLDAADTDRETQIDLTTYVASPGDAQKFTDRYFRRQWNERETIESALTYQFVALEPGDIFNLSLDGVERYARAVKTTLKQGRIDVEWVRDSLSLNSLSSGEGASMDGRDEENVYISAPTKGLVFDIPLVQDGDNSTNPLLYYGAGAYTTGSWPGASIYELDASDNEYFEYQGVASSNKAVWGYTTEALNGADYTVWDRASSVNITLKGTLSGCTEAEVDANPMKNLAVIGDELVNFTAATLEGDGTWTISGFKRGRRGTEWAVGEHAAGDVFVLVSSLSTVDRALSDIGDTLTFKAQSVGRDLESASPESLTLTGASIKPYAPAHFKGVRSGNDWVFTWVRRTRVGGAWNGSTIPVGEVSENYKLKIYNGSTVVRTITATSGAATYTSAQQVTDFGSNQTSIVAGVVQVADAVDGYEASFETAPAPSIRAITGLQSMYAGNDVVVLPEFEPGDIIFLAFETPSTVVPTPAGYELVGSIASAASVLTVCWKRAGVGEVGPTVAFSGDHTFVLPFSVKNAQAIGNPVESFATAAGTATTPTDATHSIPGLTTLADNRLIVDLATGSGDIVTSHIFSSWTNASLTGLYEWWDLSNPAGNGGTIGLNTGVKGTAGTVSATTVVSYLGYDGGLMKLAIRSN